MEFMKFDPAKETHLFFYKNKNRTKSVLVN